MAMPTKASPPTNAKGTDQDSRLAVCSGPMSEKDGTRGRIEGRRPHCRQGPTPAGLVPHHPHHPVSVAMTWSAHKRPRGF